MEGGVMNEKRKERKRKEGNKKNGKYRIKLKKKTVTEKERKIVYKKIKRLQKERNDKG